MTSEAAELGDLAREIREGEPWFTSAVAGLQFYDYDKLDDFGHVMPERGDPVTLVRRPENAADGNAIEVWWKNSHHLGHLPRDAAAVVAPLMDASRSLRGYVADQGDGSRWSMAVLCVGDAAAVLHGRWLVEIARETWWELKRARDAAARGRAEAWQEAHVAYRRRRAVEAFEAFAPMLMDGHGVPAEQRVQPKRGSKGQTFTWWDQVPAGLATKTQLRDWGLKLSKRQKPYARIAYVARRENREYDLYKVLEAVPVKPMTAKQWAVKESAKLDLRDQWRWDTSDRGFEGREAPIL